MPRPNLPPHTRQHSATPAPPELPCPACGSALGIDVRHATEGMTVPCLHCGSEPVLARDWDEQTDRYHWVLVDPDTEYDDETRK